MVALGIILIVLGIALVIGEFFTGSYLLIGMGGFFVIFGIIFIATASSNWFPINWWLITLILILLAGVMTFAVYRIRRTYHRQVATGAEDLIGKIAEVKEPLQPEGTVMYDGELWAARSVSGNLATGEHVVIKKVEHLTLLVEKAPPGANE